jgi:hypothetical protein
MSYSLADDLLDWFGEHVLSWIVLALLVGVVVFFGWVGWQFLFHRNDPQPWTCVANRVDHYTPILVGKVITQSPVYACTIQAQEAGPRSVRLRDENGIERTITAPFTETP